MPKIRITKAADDREVRVHQIGANGFRLTIPRDGEFHDVDARVLAVLDDSDVDYEIAGAKASAGGAVGLGGSKTAPPHPLDHDNDGQKGGSRKGAESTRRKGAVRKAAEKLRKGKSK